MSTTAGTLIVSVLLTVGLVLFAYLWVTTDPSLADLPDEEDIRALREEVYGGPGDEDWPDEEVDHRAAERYDY